MKTRLHKGFTLIELMIAVAIVGILTSIAYPSYIRQVQNSKRADAKAALMTMSSAMERYFTNNNSYSGTQSGATVKPIQAICPTTLDSADSSKCNWPSAGASKAYELTISAVTSSSYTLTATPIAGKAQATDHCGTLALTNTGAKTPTTSGCW